MPAPLIRYDRSYFVTSRYVPESLRSRLRETIAAIAADWPLLPAPDDVPVRLPPTDTLWHRRAMAGTAWWVHYSLTAEGIIVRSVVIPI